MYIFIWFLFNNNIYESKEKAYKTSKILKLIYNLQKQIEKLKEEKAMHII